MSTYLIDIIILLLAAVIVVPFFQAIRFGAVPGFLIAGVMVGPSGLGVIGNISEIAHLADIGVVLLLFVIGIELKPSHLWQMRRLVFGLGTLQILLAGLLLGEVSYYFFDIPLKAALLIGPALALSSTAFVFATIVRAKATYLCLWADVFFGLAIAGFGSSTAFSFGARIGHARFENG